MKEEKLPMLIRMVISSSARSTGDSRDRVRQIGKLVVLLKYHPCSRNVQVYKASCQKSTMALPVRLSKTVCESSTSILQQCPTGVSAETEHPISVVRDRPVGRSDCSSTSSWMSNPSDKPQQIALAVKYEEP